MARATATAWATARNRATAPVRRGLGLGRVLTIRPVERLEKVLDDVRDTDEPVVYGLSVGFGQSLSVQFCKS